MAKKVKTKSELTQDALAVPFSKKYFYHLLVFCFSFLLYANTIPNNYNLDDELVTKNHKFTSQGIKAIPEILTSPYYSDNMGYAYEYRPVVHISFALEHQFLGENVHVSHFINTLLYALLCVIIFATLLQLFKAENAFLPLLATLFFAAHPVHTEVVASIKNRDEILALLFSILAWYVVLKYVDTKYWIALFVSLGLFTFALLSKVSVFGYVLLIPLSALFFKRISLGKTLLIGVVLFVPLFFMLNGFSMPLKLVAFAAVIGFLYLSYVASKLVLDMNLSKEENKSKILSLKEFFSKEVFPFNQSYFYAFVGLVFILALGYTFYSFFYTGNYFLVLLVSILCFTLGLYSTTILRGVLMGAFQLGLFFLLCLVSDQFIVLIYINLCFLFYCLIKSELQKDRLMHSILIVLAMLSYSFSNVTLFKIFLLAMILSPYYYRRAEKYKNIFFFLSLPLFLILVVTDIYFQNNLHRIITVLFMAFVVFVRYQKFDFKIKQVGLTFTFLVAAASIFISPTYFNSDLVRSTRDYISSKGRIIPTNQFTNNNSITIQQMPSQPPIQPQTTQPQILPGVVEAKTDRPLNFVETPVSFASPAKVKAASSFEVLYRYFKLLVVPYPLSFYYGYKVLEPTTFSNYKVILGIVIHLLLFILSFYFLWRKKLVPFFGILFYFGTIIQFANTYQIVPGMMADRYLLGASLGFAILSASLFIAVFKIKSFTNLSSLSSSSKYGLLSILLVYGLATMARNSDWKDDLTLFRHDIKHLDESAQAHNLLGLHLIFASFNLPDNSPQQTELRQEAVVHFTRTVQIYPPFFNANYDLGRAYLLLNKPDSAEGYFRAALALDSTFSDIHISLGDILLTKGRFAEAIPLYKELIKLRKETYIGYEKLSFTYFKLNQFENSIQTNKEAIKYLPLMNEPYVNIGRVYMALNNTDSARAYVGKALQLSPNNEIIKGMLQSIPAK